METKTQRPKYIDLHTHTDFSDGVSSPEHLARVAAFNELDAIAITDHDKTEGYKRCAKEGKKWGLFVIPGVEISTDKYHILGLGINPENPRFKEFLRYSAEEQKKVTTARIKLLQMQGVPITLEKLEEKFPYSRLGKMNLQMAIMQEEDCRRFFEARGERFGDAVYKKYLRNGKGKEEVVDKNTEISAVYAIEEIHKAGGIAIIAHPFKDVRDMKELENLRLGGLDGIEIQPAHNGRNEPFIKYAKEHNLLTTYGSDWHAGLFGRQMLDGRSEGENILYERLARALKLELN